MSAVDAPIAGLVAAWERRAETEPDWLWQRRQAAMRQFQAVGYPARKNELWRNARLNRVTAADWVPATRPGVMDSSLADRLDLLDAAPRAVLIDGLSASGQARLDGLPDGVRVRALRDCPGEELQADLGTIAQCDDHPFALLNTALWADGIVVDIDANVCLEQPLLLALVAGSSEGRTAAFPRVLVRMQTGAEATIVLLHAGADTVQHLICPVTELRLGANSRLTLQHLLEEGDASAHFGLIQAELVRDARLQIHSLNAAGAIARTDVRVDLLEPGAEVTLDGLYLVGDGRQADYHTLIRHLHTDGRSQQRFKGVLDGRAEAVFDGLVHVARDAQRTDARQENRNLLLSPRALAHSNPRLEIYADDVKCSHGSTVGQLDADALFYLRSRGIGEDQARALLTQAFAEEVIAASPVPGLHEHQRRWLERLLPATAALGPLTKEDS